MAQSDCVIIWGTNAVHTQVNVMTHAIRARKERNAPIIVVDVYENETMAQADVKLLIRPGTDGALAAAIIHVLLRDDLADHDYLTQYTDFSPEVAAHFATKTPQWAEAICGLPAAEIEAAARLMGAKKRCFFRLGYGFSRQRNGAAAMHAALSIPAILGAWRHLGGGAFHSNSGIFGLDKTMIEGLDIKDPTQRLLDQSQIGAVLLGETQALQGGGAVHALLIQNTNPMNVAPDQSKVRRGFAREDLFTVVHEHFLTDTAAMADIILPATMFLEHDDIYQGGGHTHLMLGRKLVEPLGECRSNHEVIKALAHGLGAEHPGFAMSPAEHIEWVLKRKTSVSQSEMTEKGFVDLALPFEKAHFLEGFGHKDQKFHFSADWAHVPIKSAGLRGDWQDMPTYPDHWAVIEKTDSTYPYRLVTAPARSFLNSSFSETASAIKREGEPSLLLHPEDGAQENLADGADVVVYNPRGEVRLKARHFAGLRRGVVIAEGLFPNARMGGGSKMEGYGINTLTGADAAAPFGGAAFHDNAVGLKPAKKEG